MAKPFRLISRTIEDGKVRFNQASYLKKPNEPGKVLVAIDPDAGMYVWFPTHAEVEQHLTGGQTGYARHLLPMDVTTPFFAGGHFVSANSISAGIWKDLLKRQTGAKKKAVARVLGLG